MSPRAVPRRFRSLPALTRGATFAAVILACAGCEDDGVVAIDPILQVSPDHLDFGVVELGQDSVREVELKNLEAVPATVYLPVIEDDCGGCFVAIDPPGRVLAYGRELLGIRFRAQRLEVATGTVTISSDDPKAPTTRITVIGRGTDTRKPDLEVVPAEVDFGFVPAGGIGLGSFVIRSTGTNDLLLDRISIEPADAPFRITTSTPAAGHPLRVAPGAQGSVLVRAELPASSTGTVTARVMIETNVLEEKNVPGRPGVVQVPLRALANLPPVAACGGDLTVEPWSRVTLDGSMSGDQDVPPDEPLVHRWRMLTKPDGSTTYIERAGSELASFWVDLTGRYEVELVVTDALGLESAPVTCVIDALPTNAVRIELTWDHPDSDLDLHLLRGDSGAFCDCATDCHYRDCGRTPNWFPAAAGANPSLDIDDRSGFGPENINIDGDGAMRVVMDGEYRIAVHYYSSNAGVSSWPTQVSNATVRIFVFGLLAAELTHPLEADGDLWYAGTLRWPEQSITPSDVVMPAMACGVL